MGSDVGTPEEAAMRVAHAAVDLELWVRDGSGAWFPGD